MFVHICRLINGGLLQVDRASTGELLPLWNFETPYEIDQKDGVTLVRATG